jgi:molecular chaperone Hsp33
MTSGADMDRVLGFVVSDRHARGRVVRMGPTLSAVLKSHDYPPMVERLVAESLLLAAILGSLLKGDGGQLTMQAQTVGGAVSLLVCDYLDGAVRGYAQFDADRLASIAAEPLLADLFGQGYLAITFDQSLTKERYQGIVPLDGKSLSDAVQHYFLQSEQIPSFIRVGFSDDGSIGGALMVQHLPEGEDGRERLHVRHDHPEWEHVRILAQTIKDDELCDPELPLETIVWRLFNEEQEVRVLGGASLTKGCRCDASRIKSVVAQFPAAERTEMAGESGVISVDCAFCSKIFPMQLADFAD